MPATFACPHCGAQYPVKPVLIGKTVRCTSCKNPFRLREDGIADKVTVTPPAPQAPAPVLAPAPAPAPVPISAPAPAPVAAAPAPAKSQSARLSPPTPKAGMTKQQQEARKAMADSLKSAMSDALQLDALAQADATAPAEPAKPGTERRSASDRKRTSSFFKPAGDKKIKGPAILTNEGEREAANDRRWLFGFIAAVLVVGLITLLILRTDERTAAVEAFTAELPAKDLRYGARLQAIEARAWFPGVTTFIDLPAPRLGRINEIPTTAIAEPLAKLKGLVHVPAVARWTTPQAAAWVAKLPADALPTVDARFEHDGTVQVTDKALRKALAAANLGDDDVTIVWTLLTTAQADGKHPLADLLVAGNLPTIRWCTVSGRGGTWMFDPGQGYRTAVSDYQGLLVSTRGDGWPSGWRFMTLASTK